MIFRAQRNFPNATERNFTSTQFIFQVMNIFLNAIFFNAISSRFAILFSDSQVPIFAKTIFNFLPQKFVFFLQFIFQPQNNQLSQFLQMKGCINQFLRFCFSFFFLRNECPPIFTRQTIPLNEVRSPSYPPFCTCSLMAPALSSVRSFLLLVFCLADMPELALPDTPLARSV